jgi:hypothetical protein
MSYWYNSNTGVINNFPTDSITAHLGLGWHGPFNSIQDAKNYYEANKAKNPGWKAPFDATGIAGAGQALGNGIDTATEDVLKAGGMNLDLNNWLIRIGEIVLGVVLVGVGIAKLTGASNVISKAVKAAPEVAAL